MDRTEKNSIARYRAAIVMMAPLVLLGAFVYHPFIAFLTDAQAVGEVATKTDTFRWGLAHLATAIGSSLMILAFMAIRAFLHDAGEDRYSRRALPLLALGGAMYAVLPGIELGAIAVVEMGGSVARMEEVLDPWFVSILLTGALLNAIGCAYLIRGIRASRVLGAGQTALVTIALVIFALARFVPLGLVQFYVQGLAAVAGLWTIAQAIRGGVEESLVEQARPVPAR